MNATAVRLIARREIVSRVQQRGYRIGLGVAVLVAIVGAILPSVFRGNGSASRYDVGLAVSAPQLERVLAQSPHAGGARITVHHADPARARQQVKDGEWDAAVLPGDRLVAGHTGDTIVGIVQNAYRVTTTVERLRAAGLSGPAAARALTVTPLRVQATASKTADERTAIAFLAIILLFSQLVAFCTWVAMGVVEEKSSRVVELMLAAVRPIELLTGKLVGIGLLATGQVLVLGGAALVAATASGSLTVPGSALATLVVAFVAFVLGYAFFAAVAAALASTVSRQEEVSGILMPVTLTLTLCYAASFAAVGKPDSTLARLISIVPPFSVIGLPARIARTSVPALDVVLAVVLLSVATVGIIAVAARVYRASVLHSGTRVPLRRAWRGEPVGAG